MKDDIQEVRVFKPQEYESHFVGIEESDCFYFPTLSLASLVQNGTLVARAARIEANDTDAPAHQHPGATLGTVLSGTGVLKSADKEWHLEAGDTFYIPAYTTHVFIADSGVKMTQSIIYIGTPDDLQEYIEVP